MIDDHRSLWIARPVTSRDWNVKFPTANNTSPQPCRFCETNHSIGVRVQRWRGNGGRTFREVRKLGPAVKVDRDVRGPDGAGDDVHNDVLQLRLVHRVALDESHLSQHHFYLKSREHLKTHGDHIRIRATGTMSLYPGKTHGPKMNNNGVLAARSDIRHLLCNEPDTYERSRHKPADGSPGAGGGN